MSGQWKAPFVYKQITDIIACLFRVTMETGAGYKHTALTAGHIKAVELAVLNQSQVFHGSCESSTENDPYERHQRFHQMVIKIYTQHNKQFQ